VLPFLWACLLPPQGSTYYLHMAFYQDFLLPKAAVFLWLFWLPHPLVQSSCTMTPCDAKEFRDPAELYLLCVCFANLF
jgi:hypothetical protein